MATVLPDSIIEAARELQKLRAELGTMKRRETQLRDTILLNLGDEDHGLTASGAKVVHIDVQHRRNVNRDKLEALYPDIAAEVLEETEIKILKIDL